MWWDGCAHPREHTPSCHLLSAHPVPGTRPISNPGATRQGKRHPSFTDGENESPGTKHAGPGPPPAWGDGAEAETNRTSDDPGRSGLRPCHCRNHHLSPRGSVVGSDRVPLSVFATCSLTPTDTSTRSSPQRPAQPINTRRCFPLPHTEGRSSPHCRLPWKGRGRPLQVPLKGHCPGKRGSSMSGT